MNALRDRERDTTDYREQRNDYREQRPAYREAPSDREISLGTGTILGIFFALALLCAVFFGFGYSMGRKPSGQPVSAATETNASGGMFSSFKPSATSPLSNVYQQRKNAAPEVSDPPPTSPNENDGSSSASATMQGAPAAPKPSGVGSSKLNADLVPVVVKPQPKSLSAAAPGATTSGPAASNAMPATTPNGTAMVQVAAVSHEEDADLLLSALKKRGYEVFIRHEAQDRLLHVQVGPFANKKDADIMRQRLLSDGYNAIVK